MNYEELKNSLKINPNDMRLIRQELDFWIRAKSKSRFIPIRFLDRIPFRKRKKKLEVNECEIIARVRSIY